LQSVHRRTDQDDVIIHNILQAIHNNPDVFPTYDHPLMIQRRHDSALRMGRGDLARVLPASANAQSNWITDGMLNWWSNCQQCLPHFYDIKQTMANDVWLASPPYDDIQAGDFIVTRDFHRQDACCRHYNRPPPNGDLAGVKHLINNKIDGPIMDLGVYKTRKARST